MEHNKEEKIILKGKLVEFDKLNRNGDRFYRYNEKLLLDQLNKDIKTNWFHYEETFKEQLDKLQKIKEETMELTRGQKLVGIRFNPSELSDVDIIKQKFADTIDMMDKIINTSNDKQQIEFAKDSIKQIIQAQMLTVKAITWS